MILVTHAHYDHFNDAPALAKMNNAPVYNAGGMGPAIVSLGILPAELVQRFGKSGTVAPFPGVKITAATPSIRPNWCGRTRRPTRTKSYFGGEPVGYIIELENGFKIWHMGDTGLFGDMKLIGENYKPDLVLIPIGGHYTMGPQDAANATRADQAQVAMPMHYGTFPLLRGTPAEFRAALGQTSIQMIDAEPGTKKQF